MRICSFPKTTVCSDRPEKQLQVVTGQMYSLFRYSLRQLKRHSMQLRGKRHIRYKIRLDKAAATATTLLQCARSLKTQWTYMYVRLHTCYMSAYIYGTLCMFKAIGAHLTPVEGTCIIHNIHSCGVEYDAKSSQLIRSYGLHHICVKQ